MAEDTNGSTNHWRGNVAVVIRRSSWLVGRQLQINADGGCALCSRYCIFYDLFCHGMRGCKCRCCLVVVGDAICPSDMTQENIIIIIIKVIERVIRRHHTEHDLYASISGEDTRRLWHSEISSMDCSLVCDPQLQIESREECQFVAMVRFAGGRDRVCKPAIMWSMAEIKTNCCR